MVITEKRVENVITISVRGRVDTNTSPELQKAVLLAFQKVNKLVIDFEQCEYVSSAGLRALLIGQKTATSKGGYMKLTHVPEVLMNILKMTGMVKILTIE